MPNLQLSFATSDYDHVRDLTSGRIVAEGIDLVASVQAFEETVFRFVNFRDWDVSEMSMGMYVNMLSRGDRSMVGLPVFPSRVFRISSIYIRAESALKTPQDLAGKKIGIPEWAQTAAVYTRGWLTHQIGISLGDIDWYQAGVNQPGRKQGVPATPPEGVALTEIADRSLTEMLLAGDLDAVFSARPPAPFERGEPGIVQLVPDHRAAEEDYFRQTGIFPIMHLYAIRRDIVDAHPWVPMNLIEGLRGGEKRQRASRALDTPTRHDFQSPGSATARREAQALFGEDYWPYGVEKNRVTLRRVFSNMLSSRVFVTAKSNSTKCSRKIFRLRSKCDLKFCHTFISISGHCLLDRICSHPGELSSAGRSATSAAVVTRSFPHSRQPFGNMRAACVLPQSVQVQHVEPVDVGQ